MLILRRPTPGRALVPSYGKIRVGERASLGLVTKADPDRVDYYYTVPQLAASSPAGDPSSSRSLEETVAFLSNQLSMQSNFGLKISERQLQATSACTLLSSVHGRDRRELRQIEKRDLKAAVKYGKKEMAKGGNWKYTFADIVYITDQSSKVEITSYVKPIEIDQVPITASDLEKHNMAAANLQSNPLISSSHTVLVVDQSGSMRNCDVDNFKTRSDASYGSIALDLIGKQIDKGESSLTDAVSLIEMSDDALVVFEREPMTNVLFNQIVSLKNNARPRNHGRYMPAIEKASEIMSRDRGNYNCALLLLFISDGRPSDFHLSDVPTMSNSGSNLLYQEVEMLARKFGSQLTVGMIGFGGLEKDFFYLQNMSEAAKKGGAQSIFSYSAQSSVLLSSAVTSLGSRLSATRSRINALSALAGSYQDRRPREKRSHSLQLKETGGSNRKVEVSTEEWWIYPSGQWQSCTWEGKSKGWVEVKQGKPPAGTAVSVALYANNELGRGAERVVYRFIKFTQSRTGENEQVGPAMVAKESIYAEDDELKKDFHLVFCKTQKQAARFAQKFNSFVELKCRMHKIQVPAIISFLPCEVYELFDQESSSKNLDQNPLKPRSFSVLVEKMLDGRSYHKWNTNDGHVSPHPGPLPFLPALPMPVVHQGVPDKNNNLQVSAYRLPAIEGSDSEDEITEESHDITSMPTDAQSRAIIRSITSEDFPQAFSHWSYRHSNRTSLICDLQGTLDKSVSPAQFQLTDPVIHHASSRDRQNVYGRTDHGKKGMHSFFKTHRCNGLCKLLGLPNDST